MIVSVVIPGCPDVNMNSRLHFRARAEAIKNWRLTALYSFRRCRPIKPFRKVNIKIVRYFTEKYKFRDYDNLVTSMKPLIDGAVDARVMIDDNYQVTGQWDVTQMRSDKDYVTIEIKERTDRI